MWDLRSCDMWFCYKRFGGFSWIKGRFFLFMFIKFDVILIWVLMFSPNVCGFEWDKFFIFVWGRRCIWFLFFLVLVLQLYQKFVLFGCAWRSETWCYIHLGLDVFVVNSHIKMWFFSAVIIYWFVGNQLN